MTKIVHMKFGSSLFGTQTPASDIDLKSVHLPQARNILLQKIGLVHVKNTKKGTGKNSADDVDDESFVLHQYLNLLAQGQTVALDMLFAPDFVMLEPPSAIWQEIQRNRHRLVCRKAESFVGYCMTQASKYGVRGSRVAAVRGAVDVFYTAMDEFGAYAKVEVISDRLQALCEAQEFTSITELNQSNNADNPRLIKHFECIGRKAPFTITLKEAYGMYVRIFNEYGQRAMLAEQNYGIDWKALSHAVRVARECIELFETGEITFPRPEREHLLAIKTGQLQYRDVGTEIEELLESVKIAQAKSSLRDEVDRAWIEDFVIDVYGSIVQARYAGEAFPFPPVELQRSVAALSFGA